METLSLILILKAKIMENTHLCAYSKGKNDEKHCFRSDFFFGSKTFFRKKKVGPGKKVPLCQTLVST